MLELPIAELPFVYEKKLPLEALYTQIIVPLAFPARVVLYHLSMFVFLPSVFP